jgi:hypothetical protein
MSHSTADGIDGGPNSIVAEIPDAVVSAESSGFSPASAVPEDEAVESAQKKVIASPAIAPPASIRSVAETGFDPGSRDPGGAAWLPNDHEEAASQQRI